MLILLPWTVRNLATFRTFQPLAPQFAQDENERPALGYFQWCLSWMWKYSDVSGYWWPLGEAKIQTDSPLGSDSDTQRREIVDLIQRYNAKGASLDKAADDRFSDIARQRRQTHPLRHYVALPFLRAVALWFTPRVEILGFEGKVFPIADVWDRDPVDLSVTVLLFLVNCGFVALALWGSVKLLRLSRSFEDSTFMGCVTFIAIITVRTAFFAYATLPEPRYILESYTAVIALGAFAFLQKGSLEVFRKSLDS